MGDLNVDILHTKNHNHTIRHLIQAFNLTQLVELPTRVTENLSTSIDHVYATNPDYVQEIQIPKIGLGDHYPTGISFKRPYIKEKKNAHTHITFRDISSVDMVDFEFDVSEAFSYYINSTNVEREVLCFTNTFNTMVNKHAPFQQKRVKRQYQPQ